MELKAGVVSKRMSLAVKPITPSSPPVKHQKNLQLFMLNKYAREELLRQLRKTGAPLPSPPSSQGQKVGFKTTFSHHTIFLPTDPHPGQAAMGRLQKFPI